jgi:uncharacterized membrane protein (UPF0127 family)
MATCLAFALILVLNLPKSFAADAGKLPTTTILISPENRIEAELAYTDETRMKGLMNRRYLPPDAGMLFIFRDLELHSFWMKNTLIPLDLIWLNEKKEVVYFVTAQPCEEDPCGSYQPMQKAKYVLEVNGGFVKKHNMKLGDRLEFIIPPEIEKAVRNRF